jgi:hypothetical protein
MGAATVRPSDSVTISSSSVADTCVASAAMIVDSALTEVFMPRLQESGAVFDHESMNPPKLVRAQPPRAYQTHGIEPKLRCLPCLRRQALHMDVRRLVPFIAVKEEAPVSLP